MPPLSKGVIHRDYRCPSCGLVTEWCGSILAPATVLICPRCQGTMNQAYTTAPAVVVTGSPHKEIALRRRFVGRERDGSETVYTTLEQMARGERDRAGDAGAGGVRFATDVQRRLAAENVKTLRKSDGLLPGTRAAQHSAALDA